MDTCILAFFFLFIITGSSSLSLINETGLDPSNPEFPSDSYYYDNYDLTDDEPSSNSSKLVKTNKPELGYDLDSADEQPKPVLTRTTQKSTKSMSYVFNRINFNRTSANLNETKQGELKTSSGKNENTNEKSLILIYSIAVSIILVGLFAILIFALVAVNRKKSQRKNKSCVDSKQYVSINQNDS